MLRLRYVVKSCNSLCILATTHFHHFAVDLVSEEAFAAWAASRRAASPPAEEEEDVRASVRASWAERVALFKEPRVQEFVEWLDEEDESDEDDEDGDESDSGSEDS